MELWQQEGVQCRWDAVGKLLVVVLMCTQADGEGCGVRDAQAAYGAGLCVTCLLTAGSAVGEEEPAE